MAKAKPDQRKKPLLKRITEREYGGKGYRTPNTQDTGRPFGRGSTPRTEDTGKTFGRGKVKPRTVRPLGKGV